ncbi:MAG: phage tail tape measure protein, partial [Sphingobacteriales bacterium]
MSNVLEFYVTMKDMMSSGLIKLGQTAKKTFAVAKKDADMYAHSLDGLKARLEDVLDYRGGTRSKSEFKALSEEAKQLQRQINQMEGKGSGSSFFKKLGIAGLAATVAFGAGSFIKSSAKAYMDFEKSNKSYEVLAGNKGIGQALGGELNELKQNTILGPAVYDNAKMMMAFGVGAEKIIPNLKMLGEVSMGDADRFHRLTYAFSEVESAGRMTGRQLLQFANAGFNPLNEMARITGKSMGYWREQVKKGNFTAKDLETAFKSATSKGGQFYNMLNAMNETAGGKLQNLHGKIAALKIALGENLRPTMNSLIDTASKMVVAFKHIVEVPIEKKLGDQIIQIRALQTELTSTNTSHERQVEILKELEQINPNITRGIDAQNISYSKLATNIDNVTNALQKKIFLEQFNKANADTLTKYANAQSANQQAIGKMFALVAEAAPDIAQNTNMTWGQKQVAAQERLKSIIKSGKAHRIETQNLGVGGSSSLGPKLTEEGQLLAEMSSAIKASKESAEVVNKL